MVSIGNGAVRVTTAFHPPLLPCATAARFLRRMVIVRLSFLRLLFANGMLCRREYPCSFAIQSGREKSIMVKPEVNKVVPKGIIWCLPPERWFILWLQGANGFKRKHPEVPFFPLWDRGSIVPASRRCRETPLCRCDSLVVLVERAARIRFDPFSAGYLPECGRP